MGLKYSLLLGLLSFSYFAMAQEEGQFIKYINQVGSADRIRAISLQYDKNLLSENPKQSKIMDSILVACYRISEKDNDKAFKDYLDFYKKTSKIFFSAEPHITTKEPKLSQKWQQVLAHYQDLADERFIAICRIHIGYSLFIENKYARSLEELLIADENFKEIGYENFPEIANYLHHMALVFYFFRQYEKVTALMEISAKFPRYDNNRHIQLYNTLGAAYLQLKQYDKAEKAFLKTKELAVAYKDPFWIAFASQALAKAYLEKGKYEQALQLYENNFKYIRQYKEINKREYSEYLLGKAKTYIFLDNPKKAKKSLDSINYKTVQGKKNQLLMFGVAYQDVNYWLMYYDVMRRYNQVLRNYQKAYYYSDSLYAIKYKIDSTFNGLEVQVVQNRIEVQDKQNQNDKKEAIIKNKNQQMLLIGGLLAVIAAASVLIIRKNRQINKQNKIISAQLGELTKTLEQKQVLLSELQHRVKNNLQHVISILEIQKESIDFNNIDELIRGNQNRIHSMALLHKKLNVAENVNEINLNRYVNELAELVKDSYDNHHKKVNLYIKCDVESISIEKALPLGLIIVELVSNSMKHAFKKLNIGIIHIEITKKEYQNLLYYSDNGSGFDFNELSKRGLGLEIIKGLIDQLDGNIKTNSNNGFELMIYFK